MPGALPPSWIHVARALVDDRFAEPLTLAEIAEAVAVHPVHLSRTFHRRFGVTLSAYVRRRRIEAAARALACSTLPISHVALAAGFADQQHLSRRFKESTGLTPRAYRARSAPAPLTAAGA